MRRVFIALTFIAQISFSQSLFSDTAQKPVELDSYLDNLILPVSVLKDSPKETLIKNCIEPLQRGDLEKAKQSAQSGQCLPYYFIAKEYHRVALKREDIPAYFEYLRPVTPPKTFLPVSIYFYYTPYSRFYELLLKARASEKIGDISTASEGYALLLASVRYGRYYFISQGLVPSDRTETLIPSAPPYNLWEDWLERKVKELGGERYYKRYLKRFHMDYYFILGSVVKEDRRQAIASMVYGRERDKLDKTVDAFIDRLLSLEREVLQ